MIIAAKSDYISKANEAYYNLTEYEKLLEKEANIIDYVKCALLRNEEIEDFYISDCKVCVYDCGDEYNLYFDDYVMNIEIYDKQIVGMSIKRL